LAGGEPSDILNYRIPDFAGITDGWAKDGNRTLNEEDLLKQSLAEHKLDLDFGSPHNHYLSELIKMSLWNIYSERGEDRWRDRFGYQNRHYRNDNGAWEAWQSARDESYRDHYDRLRPTYASYIKRTKKTDENGVEKIIEEKIRYESCSKACYQKLWREIFLETYQNEFDAEFDDTQFNVFRRSEPEGFNIGVDMGQHYSYQWGLIDTYNQNFRLISIDGYENEYRGVYEVNFQDRFNWYSNNSVIEFDYRNLRVFESSDFTNGIFESGDLVGASMLVTNYGGASKDVELKMIGNLAGRPKSKILPVGRLTAAKTVMLDRAYSGQLSSLNLHQQARVGMSIDGTSVYNGSFPIRAQAEIKSFEILSYDPLSGVGMARVTMINPSEEASLAGIEVTLRIDNAEVVQREFDRLQAKSSNPETLQFKLTDPFDGLRTGRLQGSVSLSMNNRQMDTSTNSYRFIRTSALATYFHRLVAGEDIGMPVTDPRQRLSEIQDLIRAETRSIIQSRGEQNPWKSDPHATMVGQLAENFRSTGIDVKSKDPLPDDLAEIAAHYQNVGNMLIGFKDEIHNPAFHNNREEYIDLIKSFSNQKAKKK